VDSERLIALARAEGLPASPANVDAASRDTSPEAARWAFEQWELRRRARTKFVRASEMLFVGEALEQSTHEQVARYHASRFPSGVLVADLTAGIGADLIALAGRGPAVGFELDPERAEYARWNVGLSATAEVIVGDSLEADWNFEYAFADPARRVDGRRTLLPDAFSPNPDRLAARMQSLKLGGIKLSPLLADAYLESFSGGLEFLSYGGECREAAVWIGRDAHLGRWAVHVESGERLEPSKAPAPTNAPAECLYEADPAAIRAHCLGRLCQDLRLAPLGDSNGYLTGGARARTPWLRAFRVLRHGRADLKATRQALRLLEADTPELKQRGAGLDLAKLRRQFPSYGKRPVALAIWPIGRSLRHTILETN
jgi:hypothetical protein